MSILRPGAGEYAEFHAGYLAAVAGEPDAVTALDRQAAAIDALAALSDAAAAFRYAPEKWSIRQVTGHLADAERIMSYRLLRTARGDETALAGFAENAYVEAGGFDRRSQADLGAELRAVRAATRLLIGSLEPEDLDRRTIVNGWSLTVRAQAFIIAGHAAHHLRLLRERYGVELP